MTSTWTNRAYATWGNKSAYKACLLALGVAATDIPNTKRYTVQVFNGKLSGHNVTVTEASWNRAMEAGDKASDKFYASK